MENVGAMPLLRSLHLSQNRYGNAATHLTHVITVVPANAISCEATI